MLFKQSYTDNIIIEQIRTLNKEALSYLYEHNFITVHNYITSHGGSEDDVQDELSNTLIGLWQKINRENYIPEVPLEKWIFNSVRESFHKHKLNKATRHEQELTADQELKHRVMHLYEVLDNQSQELLHLHYFEGWDAKRIAEKFRLKTPGEAEDMILAARKKLEQIVKIIIT